MKALKITVFPCILVAVLVGLLLRTGMTHAAPAVSCGSWSVVSSPNAGKHNSNQFTATAAISAHDVWAVGYTGGTGVARPLIEHWNGTQWNIVRGPQFLKGANFLQGVAAISTSDVWAVGTSTHNHNAYQTLIEHWNGSQWSTVPSPNPGSQNSYLSSVAAVSTNDVWAAGNINNGTSTLIEHWDGTQWSVVPSANPGSGDNSFFGITAVSTHDIWAVGYTLSNLPSQTLIEHWDGAQWSVVSSPNIPGVETVLNGISAISTNDVWAVGYTPGNQSQTVTVHWNGSTWSLVASFTPKAGGALNAVAAVSANDVWAVGNGGVIYNKTLIEHWNGKQWVGATSPSPGSTENNLIGVTIVPGTTQVWTVGFFVSSPNSSQTLTESHC